MLGRLSLGISGRGSCPGGSSPGWRSECPSGGAVVVKGVGEVSCYRLEVVLLFSACSNGRSIMDSWQHELSIRGREREKEMWSCVVRR